MVSTFKGTVHYFFRYAAQGPSVVPVAAVLGVDVRTVEVQGPGEGTTADGAGPGVPVVAGEVQSIRSNVTCAHEV